MRYEFTDPPAMTDGALAKERAIYDHKLGDAQDRGNATAETAYQAHVDALDNEISQREMARADFCPCLSGERRKAGYRLCETCLGVVDGNGMDRRLWQEAAE